MKEDYVGQVVTIGAIKYSDKEVCTIDDYQRLYYTFEGKEFDGGSEKVATSTFNFYEAIGDFLFYGDALFGQKIPVDLAYCKGRFQSSDAEFDATAYKKFFGHPFFMGYFNPDAVDGFSHTLFRGNLANIPQEFSSETIIKAYCDLQKTVDILISRDIPFEKIQSALGLTFSYTIAKTDCTRPIRHSYSIDDLLLSNGEKDGYEHEEWTYLCNGIKDVIFSVVHYAYLNNYKFARCKHCGKYFLTTNKKNTFCDRNSPLEGYNDKSCYDAKKSIWNTIQKRKNTLKNRLHTHSNYRDKAHFLDKVEDFEVMTRKYPTAQNLQAYYNYLYNDCEKIYKKYERVNTK